MKERRKEILRPLFPAMIVKARLKLPKGYNVWRRFCLDPTTTFFQLHLILLSGFGWSEHCPHEFIVDGKYSLLQEENNLFASHIRGMTEEKFTIEAAEQVYRTVRYIHDDEWIHTVTFEKYLFQEENPTIPTLIAGAGDRPKENYGGFAGFFALEVFCSEEDRDKYPAARSKIAREFDRYYDFDRINQELRRRFSKT